MDIECDGRLVPLLLDLPQPEEVETPDAGVLIGAVRAARTLGVEGDHAQDLVVVPKSSGHVSPDSMEEFVSIDDSRDCDAMVEDMR